MKILVTTVNRFYSNFLKKPVVSLCVIPNGTDLTSVRFSLQPPRKEQFKESATRKKRQLRKGKMRQIDINEKQVKDVENQFGKCLKKEIKRDNDEEDDDDNVNKMKKNNGNKRLG